MIENIKPFFYAVADNEGKPVMDEICCCESPDELAEYFQDQIEDLKAKVVPVYTGPQIEALREKLDQAIAMIDTTAAHEAVARQMHADLVVAIARSGLDRSLCRCCGKLVLCIPDGLSNMCEPCAEREASNAKADLAPASGAQVQRLVGRISESGEKP